MKLILERYMVWVFVFFTIFETFLFSYLAVGSWDLNRSIGWGWDITNYLFYYAYIKKFFLIIGYGVVFFLKRKNIYYLSALHLLLIIVPLFLPLSQNYDLTNDLFEYGSWVVFLLNIFLSKKI